MLKKSCTTRHPVSHMGVSHSRLCKYGSGTSGSAQHAQRSGGGTWAHDMAMRAALGAGNRGHFWRPNAQTAMLANFGGCAQGSHNALSGTAIGGHACSRAVRFLSLGQWTLAHSLGGPGPLNTKNKNRAPKARFCGQNSPKRAGFHAFWSPKQQCNHPITPSTDPTDPARRPPDRPTGPPPPTPWTHPWH